MSTDVTVADIYEETARVLETEGWIRGEFHSNDPNLGSVLRHGWHEACGRAPSDMSFRISGH